MKKDTKPNAKSQALLKECVEFQSALQMAGFAEATQKMYLRSLNNFAKRLDRKTPATATLKEAKRHLTELKQSGASSTAYGTASASLRFFFEKVHGIEWKPVSAQKCGLSSPQLGAFRCPTGIRARVFSYRSLSGNRSDSLSFAAYPPWHSGKHIRSRIPRQLSPTRAFHVRYGTLKAFLCSDLSYFGYGKTLTYFSG